MKKQTAHEYAQLILDAARHTAVVDEAGHINGVTCRAPECGRHFVSVARLRDHAEAVHTFDDIRRILSEYLRERFGKSSTATSNGTWVWIDDLADDWVVFQVEEGNESTLLKASYAIAGDSEVTLGDPVEVVRRTVYDPVKKAE